MKNRDSLEGFDFSLFERGERVLAAFREGPIRSAWSISLPIIKSGSG